MSTGTPVVPPLRRYLNRYGLTIAEFHRRFNAVSDSKISDVAVSHWARGVVAPRSQHQMTIQDLTRGEITVFDWAEWQESQRRASLHE